MKQYRYLLYLLILIFTAGSPLLVCAAPFEVRLGDINLVIGGGYQRTTLDVENYYTGETRAKFREPNVAPYFELNVANILFDKQHLGATLKWGYSQATLDTQVYNGAEVSYGSSMDLKYSYLLPYFYYASQTLKVDNVDNINGFRVGLGAGLGSMTYKGTSVFSYTGNTELNYLADRVLVKVLQMSLDYRYKNYLVELKHTKLKQDTSISLESTNEFSATNLQLNVGYVFYF